MCKPSSNVMTSIWCASAQVAYCRQVLSSAGSSDHSWTQLEPDLDLATAHSYHARQMRNCVAVKQVPGYLRTCSMTCTVKVCARSHASSTRVLGMTLNCFVLGVTLKRLARSVLESASDPQCRRFQEDMAASEFFLVNRRCGVEGWACGASVGRLAFDMGVCAGA